MRAGRGLEGPRQAQGENIRVVAAHTDVFVLGSNCEAADLALDPNGESGRRPAITFHALCRSSNLEWYRSNSVSFAASLTCIRIDKLSQRCGYPAVGDSYHPCKFV
jgi:hypothetical protein